MQGGQVTDHCWQGEYVKCCAETVEKHLQVEHLFTLCTHTRAHTHYLAKGSDEVFGHTAKHP